MSPRMQRERAFKGPAVQGFGTFGFVIEGAQYRAAMLTPEWAREWSAPELQALSQGDLSPLLDVEPRPEFLLLGTGETTRFPPRDLVKALDDRGIGLEAMDSRAAARTWSLLRTEDRWIVAALMPLEKR
jgi:uncharacterized protein